MSGGSALVVVSERSADQRLFSRGGLASDADGTTTFPGGRRGRCITLQSGQSEVAPVRGLQHELAVDCYRWRMWLVLCGAGRGQREGDFSLS